MIHLMFMTGCNTTRKAPKSMYKTRSVAILSKTKSARICRLFVGICRFTVEQSVNSLNLVSRKIYLSQYTDEKRNSLLFDI